MGTLSIDQKRKGRLQHTWPPAFPCVSVTIESQRYAIFCGDWIQTYMIWYDHDPNLHPDFPCLSQIKSLLYFFQNGLLHWTSCERNLFTKDLSTKCHLDLNNKLYWYYKSKFTLNHCRCWFDVSFTGFDKKNYFF